MSEDKLAAKAIDDKGFIFFVFVFCRSATGQRPTMQPTQDTNYKENRGSTLPHGSGKSSSTTDPQPEAAAVVDTGVRRLKTARAFSL